MEFNSQLYNYHLQKIKAHPNVGLGRFHNWRHRKVHHSELTHSGKQALSHQNSSKQSWRESLQLASVAGLQRVSQATSTPWIILWSILLILGIVCTARDVITVTVQYLEYPVLTSVTLDQVAALPFPAVTVCNLNRVHCGNLRRLAAAKWGTELGAQLLKLHDLTDCQLHFETRTGRQVEDNTEAISQTIFSTTEMTPEDSSKSPQPANQTRSFNDLMHFMAVYANFTSDVQSKIGHSYEDFIRSCTFSGESCLNSSLFFDQYSSNSYGNCFTFHTRRKTVIPGKEYGLSMELYLDQANYLRAGLSPQAGARVVVHEQNHEPLPQEMGINLSPSAATSIALLQVQVTRLQSPYQSNCTHNWDQSTFKQYVGSSFTYSAQRCQRICLQLAFEDSCDCAHPAYMDLQRGYPPCNLTSGTIESVCARQVAASFESRAKICSCNMDCREITYETTISTASWPTDSDWCTAAKRLLLVDSCENSDQEFAGDQRQQDRFRIQRNLLKIDVYLQSLRVRSVSQTPSMPPQVFVAALGGGLSLYLGLSLLSLLEIGGLVVYFFKKTIRAAIICLKNLKRKDHKHHLSSSNPFLVAGRFTPPHKLLHQSKIVW